jgi:hypothetical protein
MTSRDGKCCEHCLIGGTIITMYGKARVYECELGQRNSDRDCCIGFFEPCDYYPGCFTSRSTWPSKLDRPAKFKYERIEQSKMRKSKECLKEEKEDQDRISKERENLRNQALELLKKAESLR